MQEEKQTKAKRILDYLSPDGSKARRCKSRLHHDRQGKVKQGEASNGNKNQVWPAEPREDTHDR
jgi:hypothetical protein